MMPSMSTATNSGNYMLGRRLGGCAVVHVFVVFHLRACYLRLPIWGMQDPELSGAFVPFLGSESPLPELAS